MDKNTLNIIERYLEKNKDVKFAYLFGSHARNNSGPISDIDLAVYIDNHFDLFAYRLRLMEEISRLIKGKSFDLVVLNDAPQILQYEIIKDGKVLIEHREERIKFETRVLRDYLDFEQIRSVHLSSLKKSFRRESHLGQ